MLLWLNRGLDGCLNKDRRYLTLTIASTHLVRRSFRPLLIRQTPLVIAHQIAFRRSCKIDVHQFESLLDWRKTKIEKSDGCA